ncbi:MAG: hypothetical protein Q9181_004778 [Wetmoreana brouardii]
MEDNLHPSQLLLAILALAIILKAGQVIYRLIWHPLATFPGPKVAAATNIYGAYHDLISDGSLCKKVAKLHDIYGPVVRISPSEIHVKDLESYNKIFCVGTSFIKRWEFYNSHAIAGSLLNILDTPTARQRREAYTHYFSKDAIRRVEPLIHQKVDRFLARLREARRKEDPVDLSLGFRCLAADVIVDYAYQEDFGGLSAESFKHPVIEAGDDLLIYAQWGLYFRKLFMTLDFVTSCLPDSVISTLSPQLLAIRNFETVCARRIQRLKARPKNYHSELPTIFDTLLNPQKNKNRAVPSNAVLTSEAILMLLAGTDTTANCLVVGTYGVLHSPKTLEKLSYELREAIPDPEDPSGMTADRLRKLPYLSACIKESLRLSYGAPGRLPRVVPASGTTVGDISIPAGTVISHSNYVYHSDESVFPNAGEFVPERWLDGNVRELERHLLAFARGSRMCLGMHLANAELLITFARLFRSVEMSIWQTTPEDMEWRDYSVALFRGHLKVMIEKAAVL